MMRPVEPPSLVALATLWLICCPVCPVTAIQTDALEQHFSPYASSNKTLP